MQDKGGSEIKNSKSEPAKVIPLYKTYIWGIVFCLAALLAIILFNFLRAPSIPASKIDYLALLRDNHNLAIDLHRVIRKGDYTFGDLQDIMMQKTGKDVQFPEWLGKDPSAEIIAVRASKIGDDDAVSLLFQYDERMNNFLTLYATRPEIQEFDTITIEDHVFHIYSWGRTNAFFWELLEDNLPITYCLISDLESSRLQQMAFETMLSLRNSYKRGDQE